MSDTASDVLLHQPHDGDVLGPRLNVAWLILEVPEDLPVIRATAASDVYPRRVNMKEYSRRPPGKKL